MGGAEEVGGVEERPINSRGETLPSSELCEVKRDTMSGTANEGRPVRWYALQWLERALKMLARKRRGSDISDWGMVVVRGRELLRPNH